MPNVISNARKHKLSDAERIVMSAASCREDRCLVPMEKAKTATLRKTRDKLVEAGFTREILAIRGAPVWRQDEEAGRAYALKLTAAGSRAIAVDDENEREDPSPVVEKPEEEALARSVREAATEESATPGAHRNDVAIAAESPVVEVRTDNAIGGEPASLSSVIVPPRPGSKLAAVIELLARVEGASTEELIAATGWLPHTTRAALTGLRKRGYALRTSREAKSTRHKLAAGTTLPTPDDRRALRGVVDHGVGEGNRTKGNDNQDVQEVAVEGQPTTADAPRRVGRSRARVTA